MSTYLPAQLTKVKTPFAACILLVAKTTQKSL